MKSHFKIFIYINYNRTSSWAQLGYSIGDLLAVPNVVEFTRALNALVSEFEHDKNESTSQKMVYYYIHINILFLLHIKIIIILIKLKIKNIYI